MVVRDGVVAQLVPKPTGSPAVRSPISLPVSPDSSQIHKHITGEFHLDLIFAAAKMKVLKYRLRAHYITSIHDKINGDKIKHLQARMKWETIALEPKHVTIQSTLLYTASYASSQNAG